jgi:hypothetical protein
VALHFRGKFLGLGAEFFCPGSCEQLPGLLVFYGRLAGFFLAACQLILPDLFGRDGLDPGLKVGRAVSSERCELGVFVSGVLIVAWLPVVSGR